MSGVGDLLMAAATAYAARQNYAKRQAKQDALVRSASSAPVDWNNPPAAQPLIGGSPSAPSASVTPQAMSAPVAVSQDPAASPAAPDVAQAQPVATPVVVAAPAPVAEPSAPPPPAPVVAPAEDEATVTSDKNKKSGTGKLIDGEKNLRQFVKAVATMKTQRRTA